MCVPKEIASKFKNVVRWFDEITGESWFTEVFGTSQGLQGKWPGPADSEAMRVYFEEWFGETYLGKLQKAQAEAVQQEKPQRKASEKQQRKASEKEQKPARKASEKEQKSVRKPSEKEQKSVRKPSEKEQKSVRKASDKQKAEPSHKEDQNWEDSDEETIDPIQQKKDDTANKTAEKPQNKKNNKNQRKPSNQSDYVRKDGEGAQTTQGGTNEKNQRKPSNQNDYVRKDGEGAQTTQAGTNENRNNKNQRKPSVKNQRKPSNQNDYVRKDGEGAETTQGGTNENPTEGNPKPKRVRREKGKNHPGQNKGANTDLYVIKGSNDENANEGEKTDTPKPNNRTDRGKSRKGDQDGSKKPQRYNNEGHRQNNNRRNNDMQNNDSQNNDRQNNNRRNNDRQNNNRQNNDRKNSDGQNNVRKNSDRQNSDRQNNQRYDRRQNDFEEKGETKGARYERWEKEIEVTIDTVIPELPSDHKTKPKPEDLKAQLKEFNTKIDSNYDEIDKLKTDRAKEIKAAKALKKEKFDGKKEITKKYNVELSKLFAELKAINGTLNELAEVKKTSEKEITNLGLDLADLVRQCYGKKLMKTRECENRIEDLNYRQQTEKLTAMQERSILKDLRELKNTLTVITQCADVETQIKKAKDKKGDNGKKMKNQIDRKQEIGKKITATKSELQKATEATMKDDRSEGPKKDSKHPISVNIDKLKDDISATIKDRKQAIEDFDKAVKEAEEQGELEEKIAWMKRRQTFLIRKKKEDDEKKAIEEEEARIEQERKDHEAIFGKPRKFQTQIDFCDNLIGYLGTLKPKNREIGIQGKVQGIIYDKSDINEKLKGDNWKKEKVHVLESKKDQGETGVQPGEGKHKKKGNKKDNNQEDLNTRLTFTIETLSIFDQIKLTPPKNLQEIDDVVKLLTTKKELFLKMSDEDNEDGKKTKVAQDDKGSPAKRDEGNRGKGAKAKGNVNLNDEKMFPSM